MISFFAQLKIISDLTPGYELCSCVGVNTIAASSMNASGALQSIRSNALYLQVQGVLQARQDAKTEELIKKPKGLWLTLIPVAGIVHFYH